MSALKTRYGIRSPTVRRPTRRIRRKKYAYSKVLLAVLLAFTLAGNAASYLLAWQGHETAEGVTTTLTTVFGAAVVGYLVKSLGEHASMNRHGITEEDEDIGG